MTEKKISPYDKFQALRRKPSYRADYHEFLLWCRENNIDETEYLDHPEAVKRAEKLCKQYGITYLFHPSVHIFKNWGDKFFNDEKEIVEILYPSDYRDVSDDELRKGMRPTYLPIPVFNNGDNLIIKIDLQANKEAILAEIIDYLKYYQYFICKTKSRMTPDRKVNKWEVWEAYNQTKSFEKAVQKLNDRAANYMRIFNDIGIAGKAPQKINVSTARKSYYRAFELVYDETFDPEKHKPEKLPVKLSKTCDKCPEYSTCKDLCPEVLEYAEQDDRYADYIPPTPVDEYIRRKEEPDNQCEDESSDLETMRSPSSFSPEEE